jgi:predicted nuclease with TOPRIM domain
MYEDDKAKLAKTIAEYERLRKLLRDLDARAGQVDGRLVEIERELPDSNVHPDDPPCRQHGQNCGG